jgi:hypothetical protein
MNSRPRRYLFTGHSNGTIQIWDLTTALELKPCDQTYLGGPSATEFVRLLDQCDLASNSGYSTPTTNCMSQISPAANNITSHNFLQNSSISKLTSKNLLLNTHIVHLSTNSNQNIDDLEKNA